MRRLLHCSFAAAVAVLSTSRMAAAQQGTGGGGLEASHPDVVTPPALLARAEATYPPDALRAGLSGTVGLEVVVDDRGNVEDARVTTPAGHGFDDAALAAVRRFTFEPAKRNGAAMRSTVQLSYAFHPPPPPPPRQTMLLPAPPPLQQGPDQSTLVVAARPRVPIGAPPERNAASDSSMDQRELALHPRYRAEGLLEAVPGLFSVQHAGGGKAQQDFARGFNLDHGTDMAFFVDDVPINAVTHAHGQGYSDLHFIIPETVARVDSTKGTYAASVGDFGTAGSTSFRMADHTAESLAKLELAPSTGHERLVVVESPDLGDRWRMAVAAEAFAENGPFIHPENYDRFNGYAKLTRVLDERSELSFMLQAYSGSWNMSGVLPARSVCGEGDGTPTPARYSGSSCISRWDSVDPTQGGASERVALSAEYRRQLDDRWDLKASLFTLRSNLQLFPNDGLYAPFQPEGIKYGSQIEQDDTREESGAHVRLTNRTTLAGIPLRTTLGLQIRDDDIDSQLHRTQARHRLDGVDANIPGPIYDGHIDETELAAYIEEEIKPARWLRFVLGARGDRVDAAVNNESQTALDKASGTVGAGQLSPKANAVVTPWEGWDVFANYGRGFHTNDARTLFPVAIHAAVDGTTTVTTLGNPPALIAAADAYEIGTTLRPFDGLSLSVVGFLIDLTSEITIDGDTASTSPSGSTRRFGFELTGRYNLDDRIYADVSFTAAHSRYTDAADVAAGTVYLPDAPIRTFSAGLGARQPVGPVTAIGAVTVRSMSDRYGDSGPDPLIETGWTVVNASLGARWKHLELVADLFNVGDVQWREGQFEVASRLPLESTSAQHQPPAGISFTPGLPRTLMMRASVYW
jgi:TonB family protein